MGEDAEKLVVGFSYSMLGGVLSSAFLYVAGILVMRFLGPKDYGLYQLVFLVPSLLAPFLTLGISVTLVRFVSKFLVTDRAKALGVARFLFFTRILVSLTAGLAVAATAPWISQMLGEAVTPGIRLAGIFLFSNMVYLFMLSLFQSFFLMKERTILMIVYSALYLLVVPVLIGMDLGYLAPIIGFAAATLATFLFSLVLAWRRGLNLMASPSREGIHLLEQLKFAAPTYATLLLSAFFAQAGVLLIRLGGLAVIDIGYFRAVFNIVGVGSFIAIALNVVVLPYVSELESKGDLETLRYFCSLIVKLLILIGVPASIGIFLVSKPVLEALLPQYLEALILMKVLSLMLLFLPVLSVGNTILMGLGRPRIVMYADLIITVVVLGLGAALTPFAGTRGIAAAYVASVILGMLYSLYEIHRLVGLRIRPSSIAYIGIATAVMAGATAGAMMMVSSPLLQIAVAVPLGAAIYLALAFLLHALNEDEIRVIRKALGIARSRARMI